jgi:biotin carboxyl carrier protein
MIRKLRVTVDGKPYDVSVEMDEDPSLQAAAPAQGPASVSVAAASIAAPAASSPAAAPAAAAGPGDIPSPLAGRVTAINVQAGQEVKEGDHLLTLEAMKMNTFVMAPRPGKVAEVKVAVGSAVEEGQALVAMA